MVTGALEVERREKRIGASLEAAPEVYVADAALRAALGDVAFEDVCITSELALAGRRRTRRRLPLDDVPGVAVVPSARRGREVRALLEDPARRRRHPHPGVCERCDAALA